MFLKWHSIKGNNHQKRVLILVLALVMSLSYSACRADNSMPSSASSQMPREVSTQQVNSMKIEIKVKDQIVTATLIDSKTTRDFISLLTLEDYASTEKISNLPKKLSTEDAPLGSDPSIGDIAYYAPWGNLAIYYRDFGYSNGLVILGKIDGGIEALNVPGSVEVTIEPI